MSSTPTTGVQESGVRRGAQFSVHRRCQWLWFPLLRSNCGGGQRWSVHFLMEHLKYCQVLWEFICSVMYKNLWLREARAGFSSQRGAAIERRRDGGVSPQNAPVFSSGVLCLENFF